MGDDYGGPPGPNQSVLPFNPQHQQQHQGGDQHNPRAQAYMWQQNHYMESGFHSGSTTQPPSMTGQEDEQDGSYCGTGANSMTGSSLYDLDSQNQSGEKGEKTALLLYAAVFFRIQT